MPYNSNLSKVLSLVLGLIAKEAYGSEMNSMGILLASLDKSQNWQIYLKPQTRQTVNGWLIVSAKLIYCHREKVLRLR